MSRLKTAGWIAIFGLMVLSLWAFIIAVPGRMFMESMESVGEVFDGLMTDYVSCFAEQGQGRIDACTRLIQSEDTDRAQLPLIYFHRGAGYASMRRYEPAVRDFEKALDLDPDFALALNGLAWLRATASEQEFRNGAKAVRLAEAAVQLETSPEHRDTLAAAYAEVGRFRDAVQEQERAIAMLTEEDDEHFNLQAFRARLALYRKDLPYRE